MYRIYAPIENHIANGKLDVAKSMLDELSADLDSFEDSRKNKLFKMRSFIDFQRRKLKSYYDKLEAAQNKTESLQDMDKRCEKCNTLLSDNGSCPKCDEGEEDIDEAIDSRCSDYHVRKYGAYWFGIIGPDGLMLRDENNKLRLFKTKADAQAAIDSECTNLQEELSVREKLKAAYPELNFDTPVTEEFVSEALSNREKLLRAFPELNLDKDPLTEALGADTAQALKDTMLNLAKDDKNKWAKTTADIVEAIPDSFMDELFDNVQKNLAKVKLPSSDKKKVIDAAEDAIVDDIEDDTLGSILDAIDITKWSKKNPKFVKSFLLTVLGIIAVIEPTPVVEVLTGILMLIPEDIVAKITSIFSVISSPVSAGVATANAVMNEELSAREKLKAAYPELNFDDTSNNLTTESFEEEDYFEYDDDYDNLDDVEQDRVHAALYGGDRMYCDCGAKLAMNEYGSYCPKCEPQEFE